MGTRIPSRLPERYVLVHGGLSVVDPMIMVIVARFAKEVRAERVLCLTATVRSASA